MKLAFRPIAHTVTSMVPLAALAMGLTVSAQVGAQTGMWALSVHICTAAGKCTEGVLTKNSPVYVSKTECEKGAQDFVNAMQSEGMVIKYVRCVQL